MSKCTDCAHARWAHTPMGRVSTAQPGRCDMPAPERPQYLSEMPANHVRLAIWTDYEGRCDAFQQKKEQMTMPKMPPPVEKQMAERRVQAIRQLEKLRDLACYPESCHGSIVNPICCALERRGLARYDQVHDRWGITEAGRDALTEGRKEGRI